MENSMSTGSAARGVAGRGGERGLRVARTFGRLALAFLIVSTLPACSMLRSALGISKHPPDEFAVMTKAPLVIPPDFALRPPKPGAEQPQVASPGVEARQTIFGLDTNQGKPAAGQSEGEFTLLQKAGAENADPEIRETLNTDLASAPKKRGFLSRVLWPFGGGKAKSETVDASAEAKRLEKIEPHPAGAVQQGSLPSPGAASASSPDAAPADTSEPKKKKKGFLHWLNPF